MTWTNTINVTPIGNTVQKTSGVSGAWDAGASSTRVIVAGDGMVQVAVDALDSYRVIGLSYTDNRPGYDEIAFAAYLSGSDLRVYESGIDRGSYGTLAQGDTVAVGVQVGVAYVYLNGTPVFTFAANPVYPLLVDSSISSNLGRLAKASLIGTNLGNRKAATFTPIYSPTDTPTGTSTYTPTRTRTPAATLTPGNSATRTATGTRTPTATPTRTATTAASPTNSPTAIATPQGGCQYFPADNIWHRNIASLPTHALSNNYISSIGLTAPLHASFGSGLWEGGPIGFPFITVPGTQLRFPVTFQYAQESDPGPYPVPLDAPIQGGQNSTGDRHVIVVESGSCTLYEMYNAYPHLDTQSWSAGAGARWSLGSNALRPDGWTSGDAAGLPILPSLVTYDEVQSGVIRHALRFTAPSTQRAHLWPARHDGGSNTDPNQPPMGLRVRLKASYDISGYPQQLRVILQALKDYGMLLSDIGDSWDLGGVPDARWDDDMLFMLGQIHGDAFEAVDESGLMIDPNSGQSR